MTRAELTRAELEPVIGLEVHVQLLTRSKAFCGCSTAFGAAPNAHTCPVCLGLPGALPVLNREAVAFAVRLGLATRSTIRRRSRFARKNYFYPDLPKGYQISQYDEPLCEGGYVEIGEGGVGEAKAARADGAEPGGRRIGLIRIHMEEDAGKSLHASGRDASWVDYNRAGVPLCEVVSGPELRSSDEAVVYLKALRTLVRWIGVSDGNMEEGSFRCDANVSLKPRGESRLGTRVELKNINSFKHVKNAIEYEIARQADRIAAGESIVQETRLWDEEKGITRSMRSKEEAYDYRYFPEPDLPPLEVAPEVLEAIRAELPELPGERRARLEREHGLSAYDARVLTHERELSDYYEAAAAEAADKKRVANWVISELLARVADARQVADRSLCRIAPEELGRLCALIDKGTISGKIAKEVFAGMWETGRTAQEIVEAEGLVQVSDSAEIEPLVRRVVADHPKQVAQYKAGKDQVIGFFVGQIMRASRGKANPTLVNELLRKVLAE